jgi:hypothetical protein
VRRAAGTVGNTRGVMPTNQGARTSTRPGAMIALASGISSKRRLSASTRTELRAKGCWICRATCGNGVSTVRAPGADSGRHQRPVARAARWLVERLPGRRARLATRHVPPWHPDQRPGFSLGVVCPHSSFRQFRRDRRPRFARREGGASMARVHPVRTLSVGRIHKPGAPPGFSPGCSVSPFPVSSSRRAADRLRPPVG